MLLEVVWTVIPVSAPEVVRHCRRCGGDRAFRSSGKFRVNASGRKLDVWLIYRCASCDETWNHAVQERVSPESLGARLEAYHRNDEEAARMSAIGDVEEVRVERPPVALPCAVHFHLAAPVRVRLDRLLARELPMPRARLATLVEPAALRRPVRDGQIVV